MTVKKKPKYRHFNDFNATIAYVFDEIKETLQDDADNLRRGHDEDNAKEQEARIKDIKTAEKEMYEYFYALDRATTVLSHL